MVVSLMQFTNYVPTKSYYNKRPIWDVKPEHNAVVNLINIIDSHRNHSPYLTSNRRENQNINIFNCIHQVSPWVYETMY